MDDNPNVLQPIDAYRNTNSVNNGSPESLSSTQKGDGASASEDPAHVGGGTVVGEIDQPIRGQAGWQGLGKGPTWDQAEASTNGETADEPGKGAVATAGAWNASEYDKNAGHTLPMKDVSESV